MSASYLIRKQEEIPRAVAWLEDLLRTLPEGLNSQIMEDGSNLSGGQRQRVAIARALLRDAEIILFDEATSALDEESERQVQAAIDEVMKEATVIMIAHRLNTLRKVDRIYRVENGKITPCDPGELFEKQKNEFGTTGE